MYAKRLEYKWEDKLAKYLGCGQFSFAFIKQLILELHLQIQMSTFILIKQCALPTLYGNTGYRVFNYVDEVFAQNNHTQRKLLYFVKSSKIGHHFMKKVL